MALAGEVAVAAIMEGAVRGGASRQVAAAVAAALWRIAVTGAAAVASDAGELLALDKGIAKVKACAGELLVKDKGMAKVVADPPPM